MLTTTLIVGFVLGLMSALFFALYMVPQKIYKVDPTTYLWTMGLGVLLTALIPYAALGFPQHSTLPQKIACILCGVVWGLGTRFFAAGISCFGLALATPIKNTTGVFGTLVGLILFQEWRTTNPWLGCAGSALIVLAAIIIGLTGDRTASKNRTAAGVGYSLLAALFYASYLYPLKAVVSKIGYWEFTPWMAVGILLTATVAMLARPGGVRDFFRYPLPAYGLALLGGVAWTVALICLAASMVMVDISVAWSLAQLNTVPAVFIGSMFFHEVNLATHRRTILLGLSAATLGTVLLGFAK